MEIAIRACVTFMWNSYEMKIYFQCKRFVCLSQSNTYVNKCDEYCNTKCVKENARNLITLYLRKNCIQLVFVAIFIVVTQLLVRYVPIGYCSWLSIKHELTFLQMFF